MQYPPKSQAWTRSPWLINAPFCTVCRQKKHQTSQGPFILEGQIDHINKTWKDNCKFYLSRNKHNTDRGGQGKENFNCRGRRCGSRQDTTSFTSDQYDKNTNLVIRNESKTMRGARIRYLHGHSRRPATVDKVIDTFERNDGAGWRVEAETTNGCAHHGEQSSFKLPYADVCNLWIPSDGIALFATVNYRIYEIIVANFLAKTR